MIEKNWQELIRPINPDVEPGHDPLRQAAIIAEPLERGFGMTLGVALRRILLSSLQGAAVTNIKIDGVQHEFTSVPGVREDVTNIVLNIKELRLKSHTTEKRKITLKADKAGAVTAGMIQTDSEVEVINKDHVICTLDKGAKLNIEMTVEVGNGYVPATENRDGDAPIGVIPVDAIFSPVLNVSYKVDNARVGQKTDYDKLTLEVETDGSIIPEDAVALAGRIMQDQMKLFINFEDDAESPAQSERQELPFSPYLLKKVDELELSVRSANCLKNDNIVYIGDLVLKTESEMLKTPNFGRKSLNEIKEVLGNMNIRFGMDVPEWPPENIEEMARRFEDPF